MPHTIKGWLRGLIGKELCAKGESFTRYTVMHITPTELVGSWNLYRGNEFRVVDGYLMTRWSAHNGDHIAALYYQGSLTADTG